MKAKISPSEEVQCEREKLKATLEKLHQLQKERGTYRDHDIEIDPATLDFETVKAISNAARLLLRNQKLADKIKHASE